MTFTAPRTWTDGELVTKAIMDPHIRDNFLAMGPHLIVRKPSDESVTSSTVFQADNDLILPVGVSEVWKWELHLLAQAAATGDLKVQWTFPAGGTFSAICNSTDAGGTQQLMQWSTTTSPTVPFGGSTGIQVSTTPSVVAIYGTYVNGGTGGNVALEWAQVTSSGTATIVKANSTLWGVKLA